MYDLQFEPKGENELIDLLEVGDGDFEVTAAERKESKSGNPMIKLSLKAWDKNGQQSFIYDYLILNSTKFSLRRIRHFCYSCGLGELYDSGRLNAQDCVGKSGKAKIGIQKDTTGQYPDKNVISDYITANNDAQPSINVRSKLEDDKFDDDIPF